MPNFLLSPITQEIVFEDDVIVIDQEDEEDQDNGFGSQENDRPNSLPLSGVGIGGGSKPEALHTEYATGSSDRPAYGSSDIVFYLQRADGSGSGIDDEEDQGAISIGENAGLGDTPEIDYSGAANIGEGAGADALGSFGSTGPNPDNGQIQSGNNQLAAGGVGRSLGFSSQGEMAPIGGMTVTDEEDLGRFSQNAVRYSDIDYALKNATRRVDSFGRTEVEFSLASSEKLFYNSLSKIMAPGEELDGNRDEETILNTLNRPSYSELSLELASATNGRIKAKHIVRAVNKGDIGAVTEKSLAYQRRMAPTGGAER